MLILEREPLSACYRYLSSHVTCSYCVTWADRWRVTVICAWTLMLRGLSTIPSFMLLPPHTWTAHNWAPHMVSSATNPLMLTVLTALYRQMGMQVSTSIAQ